MISQPWFWIVSGCWVAVAVHPVGNRRQLVLFIHPHVLLFGLHLQRNELTGVLVQQSRVAYRVIGPVALHPLCGTFCDEGQRCSETSALMKETCSELKKIKINGWNFHTNPTCTENLHCSLSPLIASEVWGPSFPFFHLSIEQNSWNDGRFAAALNGKHALEFKRNFEDTKGHGPFVFRWYF